MLNIIDNVKSTSFNQLNAANGKLALKIVGSVGLGYVLYRTLDIYFKRKKYAHIPGPRTKGYFINFFHFFYKKKFK